MSSIDTVENSIDVGTEILIDEEDVDIDKLEIKHVDYKYGYNNKHTDNFWIFKADELNTDNG